MKLTKRKLKQLIREELSLMGALEIEKNFVKENDIQINESSADLEAQVEKIGRFWSRALPFLQRRCEKEHATLPFVGDTESCPDVQIFKAVLAKDKVNNAQGRRLSKRLYRNFITMFKPAGPGFGVENVRPVVERVVASRAGRRIAKRLKRTVKAP